MPPSVPPEKYRQHFEGFLFQNPKNGCWEFQGSKTEKGYGQVRFRKSKEQAHRAAYMIYKGEIPKGLYVLHRCDNPPCCNPEHLFLGDQFVNMQDMIRKGRLYDRTGSKNGCSKLTEDDIREIRRLKAEGVKQVRLAERFGVSTVAISLIVLRKKWVHVT